MTAPAPKRHRVLFVDADRTFLDTAVGKLGALSTDAWEPVTASDTEAAQAILRTQFVDLVVLDAAMQQMGDPPLIRVLQERYPGLPLVVWVQQLKTDDRTPGAGGEAGLRLEKPGDDPAFERVYAALSRLVSEREPGGSPAPSLAPILNRVKQECSNENSLLFEVFNEEVRGRIYLENGDIVHAESLGRRGQSAFTYLTTLLDAGYTVEPIEKAPERSIVRQWEFLYLEAVQLREQLAQAAEEAKAKARLESEASTPEDGAADKPIAEDVATATYTAARDSREPPEPGTTPHSPTGSRLNVTDEEATRALFRRPGVSAKEEASNLAAAPPARESGATATQPAKKAAEAPKEPPQQLRMLGPEVPEKTAPSSKPTPKQPDREPVHGPRIQELLVCSYSAEVLYEWQCPHAEKRLRLVEVARERSERLTAHLPLGPVDRLELQAAQARYVLRFQEDGAVFIRSASGERPVARQSAPKAASPAHWLADQGSVRGLLAAAVMQTLQTPVDRAVDPEFTKEALAVAWQGLRELLEVLPEQNVDAWQLRWIFERAQLYQVRREDGRSLAVFLTKDPASVDTEAVEKLFKDFKSLESSG